MSSTHCTAFAGMMAPFAENAPGKGGGCTPLVVKERVRNGTKKKGIEAFPLERNGIATASVRDGGAYTPHENGWLSKQRSCGRSIL